MTEYEIDDFRQFEQAIARSVRQILVTPDPQQFLSWMRARLPRLLGLSGGRLSEAEIRMLVTVLGSAIWNATPQPRNAFRPVPLGHYLADLSCPCGSGWRYADCCGEPGAIPELPAEFIWGILLHELSPEVCSEALAAGAVPDAIEVEIAQNWLDEDRPRRAAALLERLLERDLARIDTATAARAFDLLCLVYEQLGYHRKLAALLERLSRSATLPVQAAAWRRRATLLLDTGEMARARACFVRALRAAPDDPDNAVSELVQLVVERRHGLARERARFWRRRLERRGGNREEILVLLARAQDDPLDALIDLHADAMEPGMVDLLDWVAVVGARPLPDYRLEMRAASAGARVRPPAGLARLESDWQRLFPGSRSKGLEWHLPRQAAVWEQTQWLDFLLARPELGDSLKVIDDLLLAIAEHPDSAPIWLEQRWLEPLVRRAVAIVERLAVGLNDGALPWSRPTNRPALRLLYRQYLVAVDAVEAGSIPAPEGLAALELMLRLDPQDPHGLRADLVNVHLRAGRDAEALALIQRFPADRLIAIRYGEVLARYRRGETGLACQALLAARAALPLVPELLAAARAKRVANGPGADAWRYRQAMREVWCAEPGLLDWLVRCCEEGGVE